MMCLTYNNLQPNLQHHPVMHTGRKMWLSSNNLAWKKARATKQRLTLLFYPYLDSGSAVTQPPQTDDTQTSSGIIPGRSDLVPPVSQEDARLQILFRLLIICTCILWLCELFQSSVTCSLVSPFPHVHPCSAAASLHTRSIDASCVTDGCTVTSGLDSR